MTIRGIWAWINKSHFKNPHTEEISLYRHIWPSRDVCIEMAVIWWNWIDLLFEFVLSAFLVPGLVSWSLADTGWFLRPLLRAAGCSGRAGLFPSHLLAVVYVYVHRWWIQEWKSVASTPHLVCCQERRSFQLFLFATSWVYSTPSLELTAVVFPVINNHTFGIVDIEIQKWWFWFFKLLFFRS